MAHNLRTCALDVLGATTQALESVVAPIPDDLVNLAADEGWSPKDVLAHLLVAEEKGAIGRIRAVMSSDRPNLPDYDEREELDRSGFRSRKAVSLLEEFKRVRSRDVDWLSTLSAASFTRDGNHSAVGPVTAEQLLYHAAYHDCLHVRQLVGMLQMHIEPHRGALRVF